MIVAVVVASKPNINTHCRSFSVSHRRYMTFQYKFYPNCNVLFDWFHCLFLFWDDCIQVFSVFSSRLVCTYVCLFIFFKTRLFYLNHCRYIPENFIYPVSFIRIFLFFWCIIIKHQWSIGFQKRRLSCALKSLSLHHILCLFRNDKKLVERLFWLPFIRSFVCLFIRFVFEFRIFLYLLFIYSIYFLFI